MKTQPAPAPWLWPDRIIRKRESRKLREEHNALVNLCAKPELTESEETARGQALVELLSLKEARQESGARFNPPRYSTTHGNKTALGLFRTVAAIVNAP